MRSCKLKKDTQYNGQKKTDKRTHYDLQNTTTQDRTTGTGLNIGGELKCSGRINSSSSHSFQYDNHTFYPTYLSIWKFVSDLRHVGGIH